MLSPKLVCFDSATWIHLSKDRNHDATARGIIALLNCGMLVPFFTWYHVEEICQRADDATYEERVSLIGSLPFVAFPKLPEEKANIGNLIDLRQLEIMELIRNSTLTFQQVVDTVRPQIANGFCSGSKFCSANRPWWDIYRTYCSAERQTHKARVASLTQFPFGDQKEKVSDSLQHLHLRSETDAKSQFAKMTSELADRLRKDGDPRLGDPDQIAGEFMREAYEHARKLRGMEGNEFARLLQLNKADPARLPKKATMEDVGYESHFRKTLELHESWLGLPPNSLHTAITQGMIPSWIVWREVDRAMKSFPKVAASNLNDKSMIAFAPYVDAFECDKRIRDSVRKAVKQHPLLALVEKKSLGRKSYTDLKAQLERIAAA